MATFRPRHDPAPSRLATSVQAFRALTIVALAAFAIRAQSPQVPNPLVVKSTLPTPGCGAFLDFSVADFDSSGRPDFLVILPNPAPALGVAHDPVSPAGGGCTMTLIPTLGNSFNAIARVATLNGNVDAFPDAIVFIPVEGRMIDAYGDGSGGFVFPGTGAYPFVSPTVPLGDFTVGDFNHDSRDDVALLHVSTSTLEVVLNLPTGWTMTSSLPTGSTLLTPGTGDFDGDGNLDLFWADPIPNASAWDLRIAYGGGTGMFATAPTPLVTNSNFQRFDAVADLDQDGRDDLVIRTMDVIGLPYDIPIVWGASAGVSPQLTFIPTSYDSVNQLKVVDFDVDGVLDVVVEANNWNTGAPRQIMMFRGLGSRQFSAPFLLSSEPVGIVGPHLRLLAADVDGDQDQDILLSTLTSYPGPVFSLQLFDNQTIRAPGCPGTMGLTPSLSVGVATPGNFAFAIGLGSARPSSTAILGVSLAPVPASGCGVAIDLAPALLVLPLGPIGITTTDSAGQASIGLPLPPPPALLGMAFHAQWGVADPQGSFVAGIPFALSNARTILVW